MKLQLWPISIVNFMEKKKESEIVCHKTANNGVTVAVVHKDWRISIDD